MLAASMQSARLRGTSAVSLVLRRCSSTGLSSAPQQQPPKPLDLATTVQSAVMDTATAAQLGAPSREAAPIAPVSPFTCIGEMKMYEVRDLAMCSDGHHFVCSYMNGDVALWDMRKPGQRLVAELDNQCHAQFVASSTDCGRILVGSEDGLWLWDVGQGKVTALLGGDNDEDEQHMDVWSVAITPDGRYGMSGGYNQSLRMWDLEKGECIGSVDAPGEAVDVVVSPDGQTATAVLKGADGHQVWRWHAGSGFSEPVKLQGCPLGLRTFGMSANGGVVLGVDTEGVVQQWDGQSGKEEAAFSTQVDRAIHLALSPDGRRAVLGTTKGVLSVWDVEAKACLATLRGRMCNCVNCLAMSANGRYAVSYSSDEHRLCIWHLG